MTEIIIFGSNLAQNHKEIARLKTRGVTLEERLGALGVDENIYTYKEEEVSELSRMEEEYFPVTVLHLESKDDINDMIEFARRDRRRVWVDRFLVFVPTENPLTMQEQRVLEEERRELKW